MALTKVVNGKVVKLSPEEEMAITAEWTKNAKLLQAKAWSKRRKESYPSIADQLDMLYHDKVNGTSTWVEAIAEVKNTHKKPTIKDLKQLRLSDEEIADVERELKTKFSQVTPVKK